MRLSPAVRTRFFLLLSLFTATSAACGEAGEVVSTHTRAATSLGDGWFGTNLGGSAAINGTASLNGGVFTLSGGGGDFWGPEDNGHFVYQPISGDFDLSVRVTGFSGDLNATYCKTALIFKEGAGAEPTASAPGVYQSLNVYSEDYWYQRGAFGIEDFSSSTINAGGEGAYLRLTRTGNTFRSYRFDTGTAAWVQIGIDRTVALTSAGFVGFGVTSTTSNLMTATFADVALVGPGPDEAGPVISNITVEPRGTSAIIRFQTNESASAMVEYGLASPDENAAGTLGEDTEHAITLTDLTDDTVYHYRISVSDTLGNGTTSADLVFDSGGSDGQLPPGWHEIDLGASVGGTDHDAGVFAVSGSGGDLWGAQDNMHYVYQPVVGDFELVAQIDGYAGDVSDPYALGAIVFKEGTGAPTASGRAVYQTLGHSSSDYFFSRVGAIPGDYDTDALNTLGGGARLRLTRTGNVFRSYHWNGAGWVQHGADKNLAFNTQGFVGLASTSGTPTALTVTFSQVALTGGDDPPPEPDVTPPVISLVSAAPISNGATITWTTNEAATSRVDYGTSVALGSTVQNANLVTSHSINLTALTPATQYFYRVTSLDGSSNQAQSPILSFVTAPPGGGSTEISNVSITSITPHSAQISWQTNKPTYTEIDYDLSRWPKDVRDFELKQNHVAVVDRLMAGENVTFVITADDTMGDVAVSSEASFNTQALSGGALPPLWNSQDIGPVSVSLPGSAEYDPTLNGGSFIVRGTGTDVFFGTDSFHFVYFPVEGDFTFTLRVAGYYGYLHMWTKAMTMFRVDLDQGSTMFNQSINYEGDDYLYYRDVKDENHTEITHGQIHQGTGLPLYARLIRTGNNFREMISYDGVNFVPNGPPGGTVVNLPSAGFVGFGVCSKSNDFLSEIIYDHVVVDNPGGPGDSFAPLVDSLAANVADDALRVSWKTNEPSTSVVEYGPTDALGFTASRPGLSKDHVVELTGLQPNTTYTYRVVSTDALGNTTIGASQKVKSGFPPGTLLPLPWAVAGDGAAVYDDGAFVIDGASVAEVELGRFVHQPVRGDFDLIARLGGFAAAGKAALIFKEDGGAGRPLPGAPGLVQELRSDGSGVWYQRTRFGALPGVSTPAGDGALLRLSRQGNLFRSYVWEGGAWAPLGPARLVQLDQAGYVGLAAAGATVRFVEVGLTTR